MTTKTHYTTASTWTPPAWVTRYKAIVAGGKGGDASGVLGSGGSGAILAAILAVSGSVTVAPGSIAGGAKGTSTAGAGGAGSACGPVVAGAGGGSGNPLPSAPYAAYQGGSATATNSDSLSDGRAPFDSAAGKRAIGVAGGAGGTGYSTAGTAGKSHAAGGQGGAGGYVSGGGGGGYAGGGGGAATNQPDGPVGAGGGAGSSSGGEFVGYNDGAPYVDLFWAATPLQPTLASPVGNAYIDRTIDQPLTFQANQASTDILDAQTDAEVDYRLIGAPSWTTIGSLGTATTGTIAANTLAIGSYEWRARTKADGGVGDAMGVWGPYSETDYFRADNPATAPTVTEPTSGAVVAVNSATATWAVATQTSYQMRIVGDNAGAPDPGTIYADSGEQVSTDRTRTLTVNVNHVPAHVQVRVRDKTGGVWSAWVDVPVTIEWAGPPKPRVTLATDVSSIFVTVTNPAPVGVEPTADRIEVYVIEAETRERRAILAPGDGWVYETPPSGVEVGIEAVAIYTPTNVTTSSGVIY